MIFPSRPTSLRTAIKDQRTIIETMIAFEERETDSDRTGRPSEKTQVSKVYQYIEDKVVEIAIDLRIYIDV